MSLAMFMYRDDSLLHSSSSDKIKEIDLLLRKPNMYTKILFKITLFDYYLRYIAELIKNQNGR